MEIIDGFPLEWARRGGEPALLKSLADGAIVGVGANPHVYGGDVAPLLSMLPTDLKGLGLPYVSATTVRLEDVGRFRKLELFLVADAAWHGVVDAPRLRVLRIASSPNLEVGLLPDLRTLAIHGKSRAISRGLPSCCNLRSLELVQVPLSSLANVVIYPSLKELSLQYMGTLRDISAIAELRDLECLEIQNCKKIESLEGVLGEMGKLKCLRLTRCGELDNLSFIESMNLCEFTFVGTSVRDGKLGVLDAIDKVGFLDSSHYDRRSSQWDAKGVGNE